MRLDRWQVLMRNTKHEGRIPRRAPFLALHDVHPKTFRYQQRTSLILNTAWRNDYEHAKFNQTNNRTQKPTKEMSEAETTPSATHPSPSRLRPQCPLGTRALSTPSQPSHRARGSSRPVRRGGRNPKAPSNPWRRWGWQTNRCASRPPTRLEICLSRCESCGCAWTIASSERRVFRLRSG